MQRIAKFSVVSLKEFSSAYVGADVESVYSSIRVPERATTGSAGYDFYTPFAVNLAPGESVKIPTGIRARIAEGWVLQVFPRSGLGFKYRLMLNNTVGIIDSDYYFSDNEGHIMIKMTNNGTKPLSVNKGEAVAQGIFLKYYLTDDDDASGVRTGGFGSTT